ncbi:MAG: hypothetical protein K6E76_00680 [Patescibacteria group bacterium]|nr:hypothetical protein [Patescibacteria group bacterium]
MEIQETDDPTMFITTFTIKDVTLKGRFEIPTSTLWDITFVIDKDTELLIKDLEFILLEEYKETLSYISNNPRTYLKRFNTAIYDKYLKLTTEKPTNIGEN